MPTARSRHAEASAVQLPFSAASRRGDLIENPGSPTAMNQTAMIMLLDSERVGDTTVKHRSQEPELRPDPWDDNIQILRPLRRLGGSILEPANCTPIAGISGGVGDGTTSKPTALSYRFEATAAHWAASGDRVDGPYNTRPSLGLTQASLESRRRR